MQYAKGHEDLRLPKIKFEGHHVCIIACVYVQYVLSCSLNPFCRDRNILEYKSFDSACAFKSKALHVCVRYEVSVKVSNQSCQKQEHRVFRHERFWQTVPAKAVVHVVQYTLSTATLVVILHDVTVCRSIVICQYASVCIFPFPQVEFLIDASLPLYDKAVRFAGPFLCNDGAYLKLVSVYVFGFPSAQGKDVII